MPALSPDDLPRRLKKEGIGLLYVVSGADALARERALDTVRTAAVGTDPAPLTARISRAGEAPVGSLLDDARTLPMGAERRFIAILGGEDLDKDDLVLLAEYAAAPCPTTTLVLAATSLGSSAAARALRKHAVVVDCPAIRSYQVPKWIDAELGRHGLRPEPGVSAAIHDLLGDEPSILAPAIAKLALYAAGRDHQRISPADVEAALSSVPHGTVWEFIEALEERDAARALRGLDALLDAGEPVEIILRLVARSRKQLLSGLVARREGGDDMQILERMGVHPKARAAPRIRRGILDRLRRHRLEEVIAAFPRLLEVDSLIKGESGAPPRALLSRLVLQLAGSGRR